jgi:D-sedoheptulose 7-phosphate isomerase
MKELLMNKLKARINEHEDVFSQIYDVCGPDIQIVSRLVASCLDSGGKVILCGNGGSAADCQHIAAEFTGRFRDDRRPLPAIALTVDTSALTCIGNDYGFDFIFSRQLEALGKPEDLLFAISTSGNSPNIIEAVKSAATLDIPIIGFTGKSGGQLTTLSNINIKVPSLNTAHIQEAHIFILHFLCEIVEENLSKNG